MTMNIVHKLNSPKYYVNAITEYTLYQYGNSAHKNNIKENCYRPKMPESNWIYSFA